MTRIERCRDRRAQVDISQPHHQIAGVEHRFIDLIDIRQIVDTTDKLQVARTPWRIPAHGGHVFIDSLLARGIVPGERQPDHARRHVQRRLPAYVLPQPGHRLQQRFQTQRFRLIVNLQGADPRREVDNPRQRARFQRLHQSVGTKTQHQIQFGLAYLQQQMGIAG